MRGKKAKQLRRMSMDPNKQIPMMMPGVGGQPQQIQIGPEDITDKSCAKCGGDLFDAAFRCGMVSKMLPKNTTGKDIPIKTEALICRACGHEMGKPVKKELV